MEEHYRRNPETEQPGVFARPRKIAAEGFAAALKYKNPPLLLALDKDEC
jgi:hypothetical protein